MFSRFIALASLLTALATATAQADLLPCKSASGDCVINPDTLAVGLYDIRPRNLVVQNHAINVTGVGELHILANNITLQPGARLLATTASGNGNNVTLEADGTLAVQSQGTSQSKIDASGLNNGGTITLHSGSTMTVNGTLLAGTTLTQNAFGSGGTIELTADTGNLSVTGNGLSSIGADQGGGGLIVLTATLGAVSVAAPIVAKGGDCGGCEVDFNAGTDVSTTSTGDVDERASGDAGDGGFFSVTAGGNVNLVGDLLLNGSGQISGGSGGAGGDVLIGADGSITFGRIEANGATPDGDGGTVDISGGTTLTQKARSSRSAPGSARATRSRTTPVGT
jgi:hypothetical protein